MAYDVIQNDDGEHTTYNFYSLIYDTHVDVALKSEDPSSQFDTVEQAVRFYNNLSFEPEVEIRPAFSRSPLDKAYSFRYEKPFLPSFDQPVEYPVDQSQATKLRVLQNLTGRNISDKEYEVLVSILRSLNLTSVDDLNNFYGLPTIEITDFLSVENLQTLDFGDLKLLSLQVPELTEFIDFNNISNVTDAQINDAINSIPNLKSKLGIEFDSNIDSYNIDPALGSNITNIPNLQEFSNAVEPSGKLRYPNGINSQLASNIKQYQNNLVPRTDTIDALAIDSLIESGNIVFNPLGILIDEALSITTNAIAWIGYDQSTQRLENVQKALQRFKKHTDNLVNIFPKTSTASTIDIDALLDDPLTGITDTVSTNVAQIFESSKAYTAQLAATTNADYDSLDLKSGFSQIKPEAVVGSIITSEYQLLLQELSLILREIYNTSTSAGYMNKNKNIFVYRRNDLQTNLDPSVTVAKQNIDRLINYFNDRSKGAIPLILEKEALLAQTNKWINVLNYYADIINSTILGELTAQRTNYITLKKQSYIDKSPSGAALMNAISTTSFNNLLVKPNTLDFNLVRVTVPVKRLPTEFVEGFNLTDFVDEDVDKNANRLRDIERAYMGEITTISAAEIFENLQRLTEDILVPLRDAGFNFEIIRGLRPFDLNNEHIEANNSDHHYGLAVDIKMVQTEQTGYAAKFIKDRLPWNKLIVFNHNEGSKANSSAYIHISYYWKESHGWEKNHTVYPPQNGFKAQIGGNGIKIKGF